MSFCWQIGLNNRSILASVNLRFLIFNDPLLCVNFGHIQLGWFEFRLWTSVEHHWKKHSCPMGPRVLCWGLHSAGKSGPPTLRAWQFVLQSDHIYVQHDSYEALQLLYALHLLPRRSVHTPLMANNALWEQSPKPHVVVVRGPVVEQNRMFVRL